MNRTNVKTGKRIGYLGCLGSTGLLMLIAGATGASAQQYSQLSTQFSQVADADLSWGRLNADSGLDLAALGYGYGYVPSNQVWRQGLQGGYELVNSTLPLMDRGSVRWADLDRDGDDDLVFMGARRNSNEGYLVYIYRNDAGVLRDSRVRLFGAVMGSLEVGDTDRDGDLDLLITGNVNGFPVIPASILYVNQGNFAFSSVDPVTEPISEGVAIFVDINNDQRLDIVQSGIEENGASRTSIYLNTGNNTFVASPENLPSMLAPSIDAGDVDGDGDVDLLMSGTTHSSQFVATGVTTLFINDGEVSFSASPLQLPGVANGSARFTDFDRDGDRDIFVTGGMTRSIGMGQTEVYATSAFVRNDANGVWTLAPSPIVPMTSAKTAFADIDGDGDQDLAISGRIQADADTFRTFVYLNDSNPLTTCPADVDQNGGVDGQDVAAFFAAFEIDNADFNQDGATTGTDVEAFFLAWEVGC